MTKYVMIYDLVNPATGKTYRQENAELTHEIPVGALVEMVPDKYDDRFDGVRLYVVCHTRDCDMTPLYYLSPDRTDTEQERAGWRNHSWHGGFSAESLRVIRLPQND